MEGVVGLRGVRRSQGEVVLRAPAIPKPTSTSRPRRRRKAHVAAEDPGSESAWTCVHFTAISSSRGRYRQRAQGHCGRVPTAARAIARDGSVTVNCNGHSRVMQDRSSAACSARVKYAVGARLGAGQTQRRL